MSERGRGHEGDGEAVRNYQFYACPACGKTFPLSRHFCDCGARLAGPVHFAETDPGLGRKVNLDDPNLTPCCTRCGETCEPCFGFGKGKARVGKNGKFFGGKECGWRNSGVRCRCCQKVIRGEFTAAEPYRREGISRDAGAPRAGPAGGGR